MTAVDSSAVKGGSSELLLDGSSEHCTAAAIFGKFLLHRIWESLQRSLIFLVFHFIRAILAVHGRPEASAICRRQEMIVSTIAIVIVDLIS